MAATSLSIFLQARFQGILEGIDKIRDEEIRGNAAHGSSFSSNTTNAVQHNEHSGPGAHKNQDEGHNLSSFLDSSPAAEESYIGLEGGIEDQINKINPTPNGGTDKKEVYWFVGDGEESRSGDKKGSGSESDSDLGKLNFSFKSEDKEESANKDLSDAKKRTAEVLRNVAAKAAAAGREVDPLQRLTDARQAYREHRTLTEEAIRQSKPHVTLARVVDVSSGRAAVIGVVSAVASEVLLGQSVLSQLLGRWEGPAQVEFIVPQARTAAMVVIALSVALTALETIVAGQAPPTAKVLGFSRGAQLWGGRLAMGVFLGIMVYETMHSNRPVFPFWYLLH